VKYHFIAICGTGMGSAAGLLQLAGHEVRGSDEHVYPPMSTQLAQLGIEVMQGFSPQNLDWKPDVVVVGNVCRRDHVEAVAAQERGIPLTSFPALLAEQFLGRGHPVVIAGTHGKTTCASLLSWLLEQGGQDPSFLVGGIPENFGHSFKLGRGDPFVLEGDEYDTAFFDKEAKFLHYRPRSILLTGVEFDHADIFSDLAAVKASFSGLLDLLPAEGTLIVWSGSDDAVELARDVANGQRRVEAYGMEGDPEVRGLPAWRGRVVARRSHGTEIEIRAPDQPPLRVQTTLRGLFNLRNLVGSVALGRRLDLTPSQLGDGVIGFRGVKRRQQVRGVAMGVTVIDDFAHHPTAVRETLAGMRDAYPGRLLAVFEPRSATSRRRVFQQEFVTAFSEADEVVIGPPYDQSRIPEAQRLDPDRLVADLRQNSVNAVYLPGVQSIVDHLAARVRPGDVVVVMSCGAFGDLHRRLLAEIGDAVMPAEPADLDALTELLQRAELPSGGLADRLDEYIVLRSRHGLAGAIGLERHQHSGLLKDLVVIPERRGEGLAWLLAEAAVNDARLRGIGTLYMFGIPETLRTGQNLGFNAVECQELDDAIRDSDTVRAAWYSKAGVCLRLDLDDQ
jgi:UDP-N-acetylmuramate: L-alanyl-gamma-D-glutamyl-meso-diaminopimelate ligase